MAKKPLPKVAPRKAHKPAKQTSKPVKSIKNSLKKPAAKPTQKAALKPKSKPAQSTGQKTAKPKAGPATPARAAKPGKPAKPAIPAKPTKPGKLAKPAQPAKPAKPALERKVSANTAATVTPPPARAGLAKGVPPKSAKEAKPAVATKPVNGAKPPKGAKAEAPPPVPAPGEGAVKLTKVTKKSARAERRNRERIEMLLMQRAPTPEDVEARRNKLKALIKLGKERSFLTYAEINDHLPDDIVDAEQIEAIITTFTDMGIAVYDKAPDAETLLLNENAPTATTDDDVEEQAEAAASSLDSEFGRTTDPVRMYMREMGSVELLTREGEIEIAKRIEDGLKHMIQAIAACPTTIEEILAMAAKISRDEMRIAELVDGLIDPNVTEEELAAIAQATADEEAENDVGEDADEDDDGEAASAANAAQMAELKQKSLEIFSRIFHLHEKMKGIVAKKGYKTKPYIDTQNAISDEMLSVRFTARMVERLCDMLRGQVDRVRQHERAIQELCVIKSGMQIGRAHV